MADWYSKPNDLAKLLLASVVAEYAMTTDVPPALQFVADGPLPAYDCEMLAVSLARLYPLGMASGMPSEVVEAQRCVAWRAAAFSILTLRCAPNIDAHPFADGLAVDYKGIALNAERVMRDAMIATRAVQRAWESDLFGSGQTLALDAWEAVITEGGLSGGRLTVRVSLTG